MFDSLQDSLQETFRRLRGQAKLTESNMREGLQEVRKALLEADVSYSVVQEFIERVSEKALGEQVLKVVRPTELVIKIVYDEMVELMGPVDTSLHLRDFTKIMLCGLQGSGKTTTCAKLARMLKKNGKSPLLVAADLQRPAAIKQLQVLGEQIEVPVIADLGEKDPVALCRRAVKEAKASGADVAIFDTAGRLHIDDELMKQLQSIDKKVEPDQVYLVVDGMTGQDAVNSAKSFNDALELNGVILTKLDGDQRGGAVLSVKEVTGVPVKFLGVGEHIEELEPFSPEGMAGRILGQGDLAALAQRVGDVIDEDEQRRLQEELEKGEFTLTQFRSMLDQVGKLGPISKVMGMMGGGKEMRDAMSGTDSDVQMKRIRGMIDSMTPDERRNPKK
ncbi:MAG: signal recognition particle protein, partial [Pirellulales bacterium]|nr:signal recognition particle protein [Pirellulales bacterium]